VSIAFPKLRDVVTHFVSEKEQDYLIWFRGTGHANVEDRLWPMTGWLIDNRSLFGGKSVLDLGSNAGHFPLVYAAQGARTITAVEPRKKFKRYFESVLVPQFAEAGRIQWVVGSVQDYSPPRQFDVVSCLGLVYHMADGWSHLRRIVNQCDASTLILESTLWPEPHRALETGRVGQNCCELVTIVEHPSFASVESKLREFGWKFSAVMRDWTPGCPRAMWLVKTR
jgi:2-polyprenyl-3-methyl-5-hydroxy-6-metoxy-1,4-benzoquinol methylase